MTYNDLATGFFYFVEEVPCKKIEEIFSNHTLNGSKFIVTENDNLLEVEGYGDPNVVFAEYQREIGLDKSLSNTKQTVEILYGGIWLDLTDRQSFFTSLVKELGSDLVVPLRDGIEYGQYNSALITKDGTFPCEFAIDELTEDGEKWIRKIYKVSDEKIRS